jgi:c-di-GMP-binding flagellar brake protein YcgR
MVLSGKKSRRHLRVRPNPAAPVRVDIMGEGFLEVLRARDISVGGLGIRVPHGFAGCDIDGEVELIVTLGRGRPFKTRAAIRHLSKTGSDQVFGVEFVALSPEQRESVEAYVQDCLRPPLAKAR